MHLPGIFNHKSRLRGYPAFVCAPVLAFLALFTAPVARAQVGAQTASAAHGSVPFEISPGIILPLRLNQSLSSKNAKPGKRISARVMQEVPLPQGRQIPQGSQILGKTESVRSSANGAPGALTLRFDVLRVKGQTIPIVTSLRAIAGFMEVQAAETPEFSPGFGTPSTWITTQQIGGDEVYGLGGPVTNRWNQPVGKAVSGGVLVHVRALSGSPCRGSSDSEDRLQALWIFSADACGVYGLANLQISHAGRSAPLGSITLTSDHGDIKLRTGDALLLRVH